jgi:hypothetical protein
MQWEPTAAAVQPSTTGDEIHGAAVLQEGEDETENPHRFGERGSMISRPSGEPTATSGRN